MTNQLDLNAIADLTKGVLAEKLSPDNLKQKIETVLDETVNKAVSNALKTFSPAGKTISEAIEKALQVDPDFGIPSYNETLKRMIVPILEQRLDAIGQGTIKEEIEQILERAPEEIKLSELVEKFKESALGYKEEWESGEITLIVEESDELDGYFNIYLDDEENTRQHSCSFVIRTKEQGRVWSGKAGYSGEFDKRMPVLFGREHGFSKLLFNLYACGTRIIIDEDDCDIYYGPSE